MNVTEKSLKILRMGHICNHCLGRQFAQLLSGFSNDRRGNIIRSFLAFEKDSGEEINVDISNFHGVKFRNAIVKSSDKKCWICNGFFDDLLDKLVSKIDRLSKKFEFDTFLVGTRPSADMIENEEYLWENVGIEWVEPIKAEINRTIGKKLETMWNKTANLKNPDIAFLVDIARNRIEITVNPIYIYGEYQKLKRGIPQTKWPSGKYKNSVEQIVAKPFMKSTEGKNHKFHGAGREDVDALCLAWRPFVLEIIEPVKRDIDVNALMKQVNRGSAVKIRKMKMVGSDIVEKVKTVAPDKAYDAVCVVNKPLEKDDGKKISKLVGEISQRTPERVLHRRSDIYRSRKIRDIRFKKLGPKKFKLHIRAESGTYIKEFVSGDNGRTRPSVSSAIGKQAKVKELNVVKIFLKEKIV